MTLHYEGEFKKTAEIKVVKDGRKWMYFKTIYNYSRQYRMNKQTGEVQIGPYWTPSKMYVTE